jgi:hypothetical protein
MSEYLVRYYSGGPVQPQQQPNPGPTNQQPEGGYMDDDSIPF